MKYDFQIFSDVLMAEEVDDRKLLRGVLSSSVKDRRGNMIEEGAIHDMVAQVRQGLTIFLNHQYNVPEDVAGNVIDASAVYKGEGPAGPIWDLGVTIDVNDENERAVKIWNMAQKRKGRFGLSIGADIPPGGVTIDKKSGLSTFHRFSLLEGSVVGIPRNPRSWVAMAMDVPDVISSDELEDAPPADDTLVDVTNHAGAGEFLADAAGNVVDVTPFAAQKCPTCGKGKSASGCSDSFHRDMNDNSNKSSDTPIIEDPTPEATSSPTGDELVPAEQTDESSGIVPLEVSETTIEALSAGDVEVTHLQTAITLLQQMAGVAVRMRSERDEAIAAREAAEKERDETAAMAQGIVAKTTEVVSLLAKTPLGRKATVQQAERKLANLEQVYGAEMLNWMERT